MKITIAYHPNHSGEIENIATVETDFVVTRGIIIDSVSFHTADKIIIYLTTKPARIDTQWNTAILMDKEFADDHLKPYGIYSDKAYFGEPVTIC